MKIVKNKISLTELKKMARQKETYQHKQLAAGRWQKLTFFEQMANIGSEVERAISWRKKRNKEYSQRAFARALELLTLTITDLRNKKRLRELTRLREVLVDYFFGKNQFSFSDKLWHNYFYAFTYAARVSSIVKR
ncbi:unnamed protein product [marine sediment metagenome]|uniref:Uncharacterized protein n=1 Tax=marine sediment metagenome TaxID=412755 RepID=X0V0B7_9ZZZZ